MKTKNFQRYMEKRLTQTEITEIERAVRLEKLVLKGLQRDIAQAMKNYMKQKKIGFNDLVKTLATSPAHVAKIQKGETNVTLASIARIFSTLGQTPRIVFSEKKSYQKN